jgi:protein pelota
MIRTTVMRRVERKQDMNRSKETERKPVSATVKCESLSFQDFSRNLRILGTIVDGPEDAIGDHQSISLTIGDNFDMISKHWGEEERKLLEEAGKNGIRGKIIFITLDDESAEIFLSRSYGNQKLASIDSEKSGKMYESNYSEDSYFRKIVDVLSNYSNGSYSIIILGEGFIPVKLEKFLKENIKGFTNVESYSTTRSDEASIYELLSGENSSKALEGLRLSKDSRIVERFLINLRKGNKATYGLEQVKSAVQQGAVDFLIVTEEEFRKSEVKELIRLASNFRSGVHIISTSAEPGKIIKSFGGVCAIMRYNIQE